MTDHTTHDGHGAHSNATQSDEVAKIAKLVKDFRFAMLTTIEGSGSLVAHPLTIQEAEFDGDLWFLIQKDSTTVRNLGADSRAGVSLSSNDSWVSLSGTAGLVNAPEKLRELWNPAAEAWFPNGPEDPNVGVLKFSASGAEYWDSPGGRIATAFSFIKSKVSGEPLEGDNAKVEL
ncbi:MULTISPECIES: pyridoxamine 5'-phosphate oxidase family protein [unclassified Pseudoclavibacter]|uniref:pyridoxamine 5'-phosphate oxidase family protein n=1 Tax=unclassified Pseudoclavibacter TaxID=2615177 RepID=UPI001BA4403E|nr:pyridoxamine 5'-phosphate oxidase family protein [Pseudoclavibacter sp. Marseille-Q4354]MBS3178215.1 pyridoxamine 5'-phosphate oxidase family protein [Pseudoclavibacter sp. Marseille-Q4354]